MNRSDNEWLVSPDLEYHRRQIAGPYRSTVAFTDWLTSLRLVRPNERIWDLGAGMGANLLYLAPRFPKTTFVGLELNSQLVAAGRELLRNSEVHNADLVTGDLYDIGQEGRGNIHGAFLLQLLSWLPGYEAAVASMARAGIRWFCASSLFYDGPVDCSIRVKTLDADGTEQFYNVYSLQRFEGHVATLGYLHFRATPFEIDIDLPRPQSGRMGTYTERLEDGRRLQLSGPLHMPWYFVAASRAPFADESPAVPTNA